MKKLAMLTLALCLLGGAAASADTEITQSSPNQTAQTQVTYTVPRNTEFTVTIPGGVIIDPDTNRGSLPLQIDAPDFNVRGGVVSVQLQAGERSLKNGDAAISYAIRTGEEELEPGLEVGVLSWTCDGVTADAGETLTVIAAPGDALPAGTYTDRLTFTVVCRAPDAQP